jgi:hypothetical protein
MGFGLAACSGSSAPANPPNGGTVGSGGSPGSGGGPSGNGGAPAIAGAPGSPGTSDVTFAIDTTSNAHAISPYVYGTNQGDLTKEAKGLTLTRMGGNRLSAYNWETNASNAGSDYLYENDNYMSTSTVPGQAMKVAAQAASSSAASIIMTVPMAGWVSADENGACPAKPTAAQIAQRFFPILPKKGAAFAYPPSLTDGTVYADEFVWWLESQFPSAQTDVTRRIFYMLDNEPDLWSGTHSEMHPTPVTYAEIVQRSTDFAIGIKAVAPKALIFAPVNYGWQGMVNLQSASDAGGRDFLEFYLDAMKAAEQTAGQRLVDVLDVHWYPEAQGATSRARITDDGIGADEVVARLQAPRSLWDTTYTETSWITQGSTNGPIYLIARLMAKIAAHYPDTKLSISEYDYGAGGDISGGIAQADVLGVFGREGLFAAAAWLMSKTNTYLFAGFAMYRNYDGNGAKFGDTSVSATTSDAAQSSVYASTSSSDPTSVVVVAINKQTQALVAGIRLTHPHHLPAADVYTLTSAAASPQKAAGMTEVAPNAFSYSMPARSVSTIVFHP